jgi:hypothetical protein
VIKNWTNKIISNIVICYICIPNANNTHTMLAVVVYSSIHLLIKENECNKLKNSSSPPLVLHYKKYR